VLKAKYEDREASRSLNEAYGLVLNIAIEAETYDD
jgi:hypothetical protein